MSDIALSFCPVTLRDHEIKGPSDLVDESPSTRVTTVTSLMLIGLVEVEIKRFVTSRDHMIKGTCDLVSGSPSA